MNKVELIQKIGFSEKKFEIIGDEILIRQKFTGESESQWNVSLDEIGDRRYYKTTSRFWLNILAAIFLGFALVLTISYIFLNDETDSIWSIVGIDLLFGGIGIMLLMLPKNEQLFLIGGNETLSFFQKSPSKDDVERFVDVIISRSKAILLRKYAKIDVDLPEETQMNQLNWLKNRKLISESEYQDLKTEYKTKKLFNS